MTMTSSAAANADSAPSVSAAAAVAAVVDHVRREQSGHSFAVILSYAAAAYRLNAGAVPDHLTAAVAAAEVEVITADPDGLAAIAGWVADSQGPIANRAAALDAVRELEPMPPVIPAAAWEAAKQAADAAAADGFTPAEIIFAGTRGAIGWIIEHVGHGEDAHRMAVAVAADAVVDAAYRAGGGRRFQPPPPEPVCSVEAAVAVVADVNAHLPLPWTVALAGAAYRLKTGTVPAHHAVAIAMAEAEIGDEGLAVITEWIEPRGSAIDRWGAALDELRALAPALPAVPEQALAVGAVAEKLAEAAGEPLGTVIWLGAVATAQWQMRYLAREVPACWTYTTDPIAAAAWRSMESEHLTDIATEMQTMLSHIDELASEVG